MTTTHTLPERVLNLLAGITHDGAKSPTKLAMSQHLQISEGRVGAALVTLQARGLVKSSFRRRKTSKNRTFQSVSRYSLTPRGKKAVGL